MDELKDQSRLLQKLFVSPTSHTQTPHLILSIQFLKLLLEEAPLLAPAPLKQLLLKILGLFEIQPLNSLLLYQHDSMGVQRSSLLTEIILACAKAVDSRSQGEEYLSLLDSLVGFYPVGLQHISSITRQLAIQFHEGRFLVLKSWFLHKVLEKYYGPKRGLRLMPQNSFFFYGCSQVSAIHSFEQMRVKIKQELSIVFSVFLLEKPPQDFVICRLRTSRQIVVVKLGTTITVQNQTLSLKIVEEQSIKTDQWTRIIINLNPNETTIFLNEEQLCKEKPIIRKEKDRDLLEYAFGEQLVGFMTGIALAHRTISAQVVRKMPLFRDWHEMSFVKRQALEDIFLVSCLPFSTFEMRGAQHCFDIFSRIHSQIGENIIVYRNLIDNSGFQSMGGPQVVLPLFYMARFYDPDQYPDQLEVLLRIWLSSLTLFPNYDKPEQFLLVLGHHLEALPQLLTPSCVILLAAIYQKHSLSTKAHFLKYIAWSGLPAKSSCQASTDWMNWLTKLYQNNKSHCLAAFGLLDVVYWLVIHLENNMHYCCPQHYLSESRVLREFSLEEMSRLETCKHRQHFEAVQNIAAVILQYYLIDQHPSTHRKLKGILRLLLHKYSACLYRTILRIFKRQFPKFKDDRALCLFFMEADLVPFLAALAEKTVDPGLISLIVYLLLMISNFKEGGPTLAIDYLVILFRRMETIYQEHFNPVAHGLKKLRKRSMGSVEAHTFSEAILKANQYRQGMKTVAIILVNYCFGAVAETELVQETRFVGEEPLRLLKNFMPIAGPQVRTFILDILSSKISEPNSNVDWCLRSRYFNEILLSGQTGVKQMDKAKQIVKICIGWMIKQGVDITEYFVLLKTLSKSQIDLTGIICKVFVEIATQQPQLSIDYLLEFFLVATTQYHQAQHLDSTMMSRLFLLLSSRIAKQVNGQLGIVERHSPPQLLQGLRKMATERLKIDLFTKELNMISQQDVTFLFDICLPKAAAGCNVQPLFQEVKRRVYILEIIVSSFLEVALSSSQADGQSIIQNLMSILEAFLSVSLLHSELQIDKSFLRMILFIVSHSLCSSRYKSFFDDLWLWVISLIKNQALEYKASSYSDLMMKLSQDRIQPYLVEIFETFLRPRNEEYLLRLEEVVTLGKKEVVEFIGSDLRALISEKGMVFAVVKCKEYAFNELGVIFSDKIRHTRERLDCQKQKNQKQLVREVEKLFEHESIGEQQTRIRYLHDYQCSLRLYYSTWKKIWKRLRTYHHPYGLFMAQKDTPACFEFPNIQTKNFRFKISKFSSLSSIQPILEAQVLEPWHVRKNLKRDAKHQLSSLVEMARPMHTPHKRQGIAQMASNLLRTLRGDKKKQQSVEYDVIWVKRGRKARGRLLLNDSFEMVFWYDSLKQDDSHLSFERFSLPYDKPMVKRWRVDLIRRINLRRYLMRWHALEIELVYNKSLLFYFCEHRQSSFLEEISGIRSERMNQFGAKLRLNKVPFYMDGWESQSLHCKATEDWSSRKMSTLSYLIAVNSAASRSILDVSQYPVFPWVCEMTEEKQPTIRNLSKTMGSLGSEDRKKIVREKYASKDPFNPVPPFFFGTHYSSPGVVFNYLIRVAPFTDYCKNLQGGKFDIPDRLFASLLTAWRSASSEVSDVREMIPQFYYLPECLLNQQRLNLGKTQCGEVVDRVQLPPWAGGNPYLFVAQLRQMLESDVVSSEICHWIDLIFGYKQRGQDAVDNLNVYYYLTYEDYSNCLDNEDDEVYRKSCEAQIMHFGQIPPQIFENPHPKRILISKASTELSVKQTIDLVNSFSEKPLGILQAGNQIILIRRNRIESLVAGKSPAILTKSVEFNLERTISKKLFNMKKECARTVFFRKYFLVYGYVTNEFRIFHRSNGHLQYDEQMPTKIQFLLVNREETIILIGCQSGLLYVYELEYEQIKVIPRRQMVLPFPYPVSHISEHDGFFAITFGCYVAIYKIERPMAYLSKDPVQPFVRFFRSFQNQLPVKGAFIADAPLYCLLLYDNAHLKVYSINGQLIKSTNWSIKGVQRMLDSQLHSLFCIQEEGRLMLVSTPDLRCLSELEIPGAIQVGEGVVIHKNKLQFIGC